MKNSCNISGGALHVPVAASTTIVATDVIIECFQLPIWKLNSPLFGDHCSAANLHRYIMFDIKTKTI